MAKIESKIAQHIIVEDGGEVKVEQAPALGQAAADAVEERRGAAVPRAAASAPKRPRSDAEARRVDALNQERKDVSSIGRRSDRQSKNILPSETRDRPARRRPQERVVPGLRERNSNEGNRVVEKDQQNGQDKAARLAAVFRRQSERNADQGEHDTGRRQREAAMKFDQVPAPSDRVGGVATPATSRQFSFLRAKSVPAPDCFAPREPGWGYRSSGTLRSGSGRDFWDPLRESSHW